jgi:manganese efflux pump family protein
MTFLEILMIALSMAMDATAVCLGVGTTAHAAPLRSRLRLAYHFGLFQFLMPLIGWFAGATVAPFITAFAPWITFGLLSFVGGRMVRTGLDPNAEAYRRDPSRGMTMVMLSVATSIDALAIGLSLALLRVNIWYPASVIGIVTATLSFIGLQLGNRLGEKFGKRMEIVGGAVLIVIGLRILLTHYLGG